MPLLAPPFDQAIDLRRDIDEIIVAAIMDDPRSLQKTLGPSEMGCPRCIARHFLGHTKTEESQERSTLTVPWLPWVGTAMHSQLEVTFAAHNAALVAAGMPERWELEARVPVDIIAGRFISGSTDAWDSWTRTVIDWKLVGKTKLDAVRRKNFPGGIYQKQAHIYGRGRELLGQHVNEVAIYFLPRNEISMSKGVFWSEPYDRSIAEKAIATVKAIVDLVDALRQQDGTFDDEIALVARLQADPDCFSCGDYAPLPGLATPSKDGGASHPAFDQPTPFSRRG